MPAWYLHQLDPWQLSLKYSNSATELPNDSVAQMARVWQAICQVVSLSPSLSHCQCRRQGGQQGQFAPGTKCKGAPKQCRTCSNKIRLSVTFHSSFFKGFISLYIRLKSACSFALRFMLLKQIMRNYFLR